MAYLFNRKGVVIVPKNDLGEDDVLLAVLDAGAEEVNDLGGESFEVVSEATDLIAVRTALVDAGGIDYDSADPTFLPTMQVELDAEGARKVFKLIDALEDSDEVQNVYANFDVSDEVMELSTLGSAARLPVPPGGRRPRRRSPEMSGTTRNKPFRVVSTQYPFTVPDIEFAAFMPRSRSFQQPFLLLYLTFACNIGGAWTTRSRSRFLPSASGWSTPSWSGRTSSPSSPSWPR